MENNELNLTPISEAVNAEPKSGKWVPIDSKSVNIPVNAEKDKPFMGPDGVMYILKEGRENFESIRSNSNNAVPTPSTIVQMPPIVQPIALVPYASQNQPLLQYDPYSRPPEIEHQNVKPHPRYIKKPYRGVSLAMVFISLLSIAVILFLNIISAKGFKSNGNDMFMSILALCGLENGSYYYAHRIAPFMSDIGSALKADAFSTIMTIALPILVVLIVIIALFILIKYLYKFKKSASPRCFSIGAFINLCLSISVLAIIFGMSRGADSDSTFIKFMSAQTAFNYGIAVIINIVLSLVMLIVPCFAKKNAYILDVPEAKKIYIINN